MFAKKSVQVGSRISVTFQDLYELQNYLLNFSHEKSLQKSAAISGVYASKTRGRGIDFDQVRPYFPGDDVRRIDWKITAKTGEAHTKLFFDEKERPVFIIAEQTEQMFFSTAWQFKSAMAAKLAALFGWWAHKNGDSVGGLVFGDKKSSHISLKRSQGNILHFLKVLSAFNQDLLPKNAVAEDTDEPQSQGLFGALQKAQFFMRSGMLIVLIVDERNIDDRVRQILMKLSYQNDLVLLPIYDALDHELPVQRGLNFIHGNQRVIINGKSKQVREQYRRLFLERQDIWQKTVRGTRAMYFPLSTEQKDITAFFSQRIDK